MHNQNFKFLGQIIKKFKILTIFDPPGKNLGALNQKSVSNIFLAMVWRTHSENLNVLAQKLKDFYSFNRKPPFWGVKKKRRSLSWKNFLCIILAIPNIYPESFMEILQLERGEIAANGRTDERTDRHFTPPTHTPTA